MKCYIGFDEREQLAYDVCARSFQRRASVALEIVPLRSESLAAAGLLNRPVDTRGGIYDITSNAPCSTQFANSRFIVPIIAQTGYALFVDGDTVCLGDVAELRKHMDPHFAVQVVKHEHVPKSDTKMDGQKQTTYPRKNWSSVMLFNCDHPGNRRLSLRDVNERRGIELHQFYWLHDSEIGGLPVEWNWLVGEQAKPEHPRIAHFTNGGPFLQDWESREHDDIWLNEAACVQASSDILS